MALATVMLLHPSIVPLLAHRQYCSFVKPDSRKKNKGLATKDYSYSPCGQNVMGEISVRSLVFSLQSSPVHLDPRSLLGLTTLVAAFLNSSKCGSYA